MDVDALRWWGGRVGTALKSAILKSCGPAPQFGRFPGFQNRSPPPATPPQSVARKMARASACSIMNSRNRW